MTTMRILAATPDHVREADPFGLAWARTYSLTAALWGLTREHGEEHGIAFVTQRYPEPRSEDHDPALVRAELERRRALRLEESLAVIKRAPTRLLMRWLDFTRRLGGWYCDSDHHDFDAIGVRYADIKAELATREHVPNKKEARNARRDAATMHHGSKGRTIK